jgi:transcriptional regulator with XRE-family HTH domain
MLIGGRLRALRQQRGLSQGDLERASGLLRCYISRVEHGHTVPSIDTLQRFADALGVPMYQLFYEEEIPPTPHLTPRPTLSELADESGADEAETRFLLKARKLVTQLRESDRSLVLDLAVKLAGRSKKKTKTPL